MTGDEIALARARGEQWLPVQRVHSMEEAARFVDDVGFALLFPAEKAIAPSLFEAVAGPDAVPFAAGMGAAESSVWTWKDAMPEALLAWSGKFVNQRATLLSPRLLAALYPSVGEPDDHRGLPLSPEAHRIADALATGPLPSSALRELVGHRSRYDRAIRDLQRNLLVTSAGVMEQRAGWPAVLLDLTCRLFEVGGASDRSYATARFLSTMIEGTPAQLAKAYGWPIAAARTELEKLVESGLATSTPGGYASTKRVA